MLAHLLWCIQAAALAAAMDPGDSGVPQNASPVGDVSQGKAEAAVTKQSSGEEHKSGAIRAIQDETTKHNSGAFAPLRAART